MKTRDPNGRVLFELVRLTGAVMMFNGAREQMLKDAEEVAGVSNAFTRGAAAGIKALNAKFDQTVGKLLPHYAARYSSMTAGRPQLAVDNTKKPKGKS